MKHPTRLSLLMNDAVQNIDRLCFFCIIYVLYFFFSFFFFHLTYSRWTSSLPSCLWSQKIFPSLPGSRLIIFLSRCKFSTLTTRLPMVEFYLLTFPRFPLRKKEHKSYFGRNRTHDFRTSRCAAYLLDHSVIEVLKEVILSRSCHRKHVAPCLSHTPGRWACHYLTNRFQMKAPAKPSRSLHEGSAKPSPSVSLRRLRGASKAPPRTLRGGLRTLRGGCTYRRLHEDDLEGSRGLLEGSVDELHNRWIASIDVEG